MLRSRIFPVKKKQECADDLWDYYEAHKDEVEDLEEGARKNGLRR